MSDAVFCEVFDNHMSVHSGACASWVGERFGDATVDVFGDAVRAATTVKDEKGYIVRHDTMKYVLNEAFAWAGLEASLEVECEVFGEFSHLIPKAVVETIPRGGDRQALVPDFLFREEALRGWYGVLAELKVISCCRTYYLEGKSTKGVDKRAGSLNAEYVRTARDADRKYCGTLDNAMGPVQQHLESFGTVRGLVFGAFGEASPDVHSLIDSLAEHRLRKKGLSEAWRRGHKAEKALLVRQLRHRIGVAAVRAQAEHLLSRLRVVREGPGIRKGKAHRMQAAKEAYGHMAWAGGNVRASVRALQQSWRGRLEVEACV